MGEKEGEKEGLEIVYEEMGVGNLCPLPRWTTHCPTLLMLLWLFLHFCSLLLLPSSTFPFFSVFSSSPSSPLLPAPPPPTAVPWPGLVLTPHGSLSSVTTQLKTATVIHQHNGPYTEQSLPWPVIAMVGGWSSQSPLHRVGGNSTASTGRPEGLSHLATLLFYPLCSPTSASAWSTSTPSILAPLIWGPFPSVDSGLSFLSSWMLTFLRLLLRAGVESAPPHQGWDPVLWETGWKLA